MILNLNNFKKMQFIIKFVNEYDISFTIFSTVQSEMKIIFLE